MSWPPNVWCSRCYEAHPTCIAPPAIESQEITAWRDEMAIRTIQLGEPLDHETPLHARPIDERGTE